MSEQPHCWDCEWHRLDHPCRRNGVFDIGAFAKAFVDQMPVSEEMPSNDDVPWTWACGHTLGQAWPDLCLDVVIACLVRITTPHQADYLAAGELEDIIRKHGEHLLPRIETLARRSPRFRYLLTGVWPQGQQDSPIWARIVQARGEGRHIGDGGPIPPVDDWLSGPH